MAASPISAIMAAGCVTVPTYTTNTERDHAHILEQFGRRAVIVSNQKLAKNAASPRCSPRASAITSSASSDIRAGQAPDWVNVHRWSELIAGDADVPARRERDAEASAASDLACIIYTSGTGGAPRGVQQHHGAILRNVEGCTDIISSRISAGTTRCSCRSCPLSHAYEHTGGQHFPIALGAQIYYAESLEKLAANIEEVRPTIMVVVPRLFEVLRTRIIKSIEKPGRLSPTICSIAR